MLKFHIAQHNRDIKLMESLITYLGCGRIESDLARSSVYFVVTKFNDITEKLIPFLDKYSVQGVKVKDFEDFKKVANLMSNKAHLTEEGLSQIRTIKSNMNFQRDSE
jgi:hypothetical protein